MNSAQRKIRAAIFSISTAISLAILKFTVGLISGSIAVLSSAIDSLLDIVMSGVNLLAIRHAEQPADENHAYGHGKFETLSSILQALVIGGSGVWILDESIRRLLAGSQPTKIGFGMGVLLFSTCASWAISAFLKKTAEQTESSALLADSLHFSMDVFTNLALLAGLIIMHYFKLSWLDPVLSFCVALYILFEAVRLIRNSMRDVLDEQLPEELRQRIETSIQSHGGSSSSYHNLRTRKAGSLKLIDFHLNVCRHMSVTEAHRITDLLEHEIEKELPNSDITIHIEPCEQPNCTGEDGCISSQPHSIREFS